MQAFSLRNNEVMYPIIFAATGALGLALLFLDVADEFTSVVVLKLDL